MATTLEKAEKVLAYDGDCPMCKASVDLILRLGWVKPEQARSSHELDLADLEAVHAAGIRNQLVVIDPQTRETRTGSDALVWILRDTTGNAWWVRLLGLRGFRDALRCGYQVISYNRRIISPPHRLIKCDCEPEVTVARRLSLVVPLMIGMFALAALFGAAAFVGWGLGDWFAGAAVAKTAVGLTWLALTIAAALLLPPGKRLDYGAHLTATMFVGMLILAPLAVPALLLPPAISMALAAAGGLISLWYMFGMQRNRIRSQQISTGWLWAWTALAIAAPATVAAAYFGWWVK